jgi:hypothetical protein
MVNLDVKKRVPQIRLLRLVATTIRYCETKPSKMKQRTTESERQTNRLRIKYEVACDAVSDAVAATRARFERTKAERFHTGGGDYRAFCTSAYSGESTVLTLAHGSIASIPTRLR